MAGQHATSAARTEHFGDELQRQILPDGGHVSRNPRARLEILIELLPLRTAFTSRNIARRRGCSTPSTA